MAGLSYYEANKNLTAALITNTAYVARFTTMPADDGTGGVEVSGGAYARQTLTVAAAASGATSNNADLVWSEATTDEGTTIGVGIYDAPTAGNMLWSGTLTASKAIGIGDQFKIKSGELDINAKATPA